LHSYSRRGSAAREAELAEEVADQVEEASRGGFEVRRQLSDLITNWSNSAAGFGLTGISDE
jgi:hypothetical protein